MYKKENLTVWDFIASVEKNELDKHRGKPCNFRTFLFQGKNKYINGHAIDKIIF